MFPFSCASAIHQFIQLSLSLKMDDDPNLLPGAKPMRDLPRQRFEVELNPDEMNVISWKKLTKNAQKAGQSEQTAGQSDQKPQPENASRNCFSHVLERMENIYRGVDSSDEEGEKGCEGGDGGAMEYYDCDDSFIDDSELNEYYKVENTKSKYSGFRIQRRTQEKDEEPRSSPAEKSSKKKRKKNSMENIPKKRAKKRVSSIQMTSPACEVMDKVVGRDEVGERKTKKSSWVLVPLVP